MIQIFIVIKFREFQKTIFSPIFGPFLQLLGQKSIPIKSGSVRHNLISFQNNVEVQRNLMTQFQEIPNRKQDGQTDPTSEDPSSYCQGSNNTTAVDWHLKVKDIEQNVDLTNIYCLTASIQNINSIQKTILDIKQILGSHELNGHAHF